jgi:hypothetical protein
MVKKTIIFISVFIVALALTAFFTAKKLSNSPTESELEQCNTLQYNGKNKESIVFLSERNKAEKYMNSLFKVSPFDKNKENFNFYQIDYQPDCENYKGIAILCYSKQVLKKAGSCPADYIVVLKDQPSNIRSSSYMNVISLNQNNNENVFTHEFGHAFANLADEYVPAQIPKGSKNCQRSCDGFNGIGECSLGCSEEKRFRSINQGIMKTLSSSSFGAFNEEIINSKISRSSKITGNVIQTSTNCGKEEYYLIEGKLNAEGINILSKSIEIGCVGNNGAGPFSYNLILGNQQVIKTEEFNPEMIFTDQVETLSLSGGPVISEKSFLLKIPIIENSDKLEIINEEIKTNVSLKDIGARPCII